jgi:membrane-bound lytic murein transglycosylase A
MKIHALLALTCVAAACKAAPEAAPDYGRPLPYGAPALLPLGPDETPPNVGGAFIDRDQVLPALERSLTWTRSRHAAQFFPIAGIDHARALHSLERFRELLLTSRNASGFNAAVQREFQVFKSAGWDGQGGGVLFTGYCTPILAGSRTPSATHRHPLYGLPGDLVKASDGTILGRRTANGLEPYPTRRVIEASNMLQGQGLELVWLRDPIDAFIAHVNGSAFVQLDEGGELRLGYAGKNGRAYTSLGAELVRDRYLARNELSLAAIRGWASAHPNLVEEYLQRNDSFVFFAHIEGNPRGSLNVEVTPNHTLATDKALFPRGAVTFVDTSLPLPNGGSMAFRQVMFDQDTGGAIRTAGRADIYLGIGPEAERRAGTTQAEGQLYYFFVRP